MSSQESDAIGKALDRLEDRIRAYRHFLSQMSRGEHPAEDIEDVAVTSGEVETIEALVRRSAENLLGRAPDDDEWAPMRPFCSENEDRKSSWAEQNYEFFRWALIWVQKTRTFLTFLSAMQPVGGEVADPAKQVPDPKNADPDPTALVGSRHFSDDAPKSVQARYTGRIVWTPLPDGRHMELIEDFGFVDASGLEWPVPPKTRVDGASIPQALWSIVGSPFTGRYRDASVIHDYYCDVRLRRWQAVHRVFYDAMIVSGVSAARAKIMYAAVYFAGPRWSEAASHNTGLPRASTLESLQFSVQHSPFARDVMTAVEVDGTTVDEFLRSSRSTLPAGDETRLHLDRLGELISEYDPSPEEIAAALDSNVDLADAIIPKRRTLVDLDGLREGD